MKKLTVLLPVFFSVQFAFAQPDSVKANTLHTTTVTPLIHTKPFDILIKSSVLSNSSLLHLQFEEDTDSIRFELFNSQGETMELLFEGSLHSGKHPFIFSPVSGVNRPFIAVLSIATKVVSMRVVKFNSF
ncbi:MAG: hypothetical protein AB7G44_06175 [Bacteroidia bacterium]